jgi:hypothetical protein
VEPLEARTLLSGPSAREQQMLEWVNRFRANPSAEMTRLLQSGDADVASALRVFDVDLDILRQQWKTLSPSPPLAWSDALHQAALSHDRAMLGADLQTHQVPGEPSLGQRLINAGYAYALAGENVFAYAKSPLHAHAGFAIDWGDGPGGIQSPAEHRLNLLDRDFTEAGIAILDSTAGKNTGPLLVTQNLGDRASTQPFLVGVVYRDVSGDGFYTAGEGLGDIVVRVTGGGRTLTTTTLTAGGYQLEVPAGTYTVQFSGAGLARSVTRTVTVGATNAKVDLRDGDVGSAVQFVGATANSLASTPSGKLYMAWYDAVEQRLMWARRSLADAWTAPRVVDANGIVGKYLSLALDASGRPAIAYYDSTQTALKFARFDGVRWSVQTIEADGDVGINPSLAFDEAGRPGVSYYDRTHADLRFAAWDGAAWRLSTVDAEGDAGRSSSTRYDVDADQWRIAYTSIARRAVRLASGDAAAWQLEAVADAAGPARAICLVLSPLAQPAASFSDNDGLHYVQFDGASWAGELVASGAVGQYGQLMTSPADQSANIVFYDQSANSVIRAQRIDATWSMSVLATGGGPYVSAAIAASARLSFSYLDASGSLRLVDA